MQIEKTIGLIIKKWLWLEPNNIERMSMGTCNEVYSVETENNDFIVRISSFPDFLKWSQKHIPVLEHLWISVPKIILEDYSKSQFPYMFQILNKMEWRDLDYVISKLSNEEIDTISTEISNIFDKVKTIKTNDKFWLVCWNEKQLNEKWTEWIKSWIDDIIERGIKTWLMDNRFKVILSELSFTNKEYFSQVNSTTYLWDINAKNVLVQDGKFIGIVDLDCLMQGDILEWIWRIKASWPWTIYWEKYITAIMNKQWLDKHKRKIVILYALINRISRAFENGIQYNQNTTNIVDHERYQKDLAMIELLLREYRSQ